MTQTGLSVTPTQSRYKFETGGVALSVDFLSPVEPGSLRRMSVPFSYIFASAHSTDGKTHSVSVYFDITGEWAHGDDNAPIDWQRRSIVPSGILANSVAAPLTAFAVTPDSPKVLGRGERISDVGNGRFCGEKPGRHDHAGRAGHGRPRRLRGQRHTG